MIFCFVLFILVASIDARIAGTNDATCNSILCNLSNDVGYLWSNIAGMPAGFADGVDDTGAGVTPGDNVNLTNLNASGTIIFSGFANCALNTTSTGQLVCGSHTGSSGTDTWNSSSDFIDTINQSSAFYNISVPWSLLEGVPAGFADDTDDTGSGGTDVYVNETGDIMTGNLTVTDGTYNVTISATTIYSNSLYAPLIQLGGWAAATKDYSAAIGLSAIANGTHAVAIGDGAHAYATEAMAYGAGATARYRAIALGYQASASGDYATALGYAASATGLYASAIGYQAAASGTSSVALVQGSTASGNYAVSAGLSTTASGVSSYAFGDNVTVNGNNSYGFGLDGISTANNMFTLHNLNLTVDSIFADIYGSWNNSGLYYSKTDINSIVTNNITNHEQTFKHGNTTAELRSQFASSSNISYDSATGQFSINISVGAGADTDTWNTTEEMQDATFEAMSEGLGIALNYDDDGNTMYIGWECDDVALAGLTCGAEFPTVAVTNYAQIVFAANLATNISVTNSSMKSYVDAQNTYFNDSLNGFADTDTWNTTQDMINAVNISGYFQHKIDWANVFGVAGLFNYVNASAWYNTNGWQTANDTANWHTLYTASGWDDSNTSVWYNAHGWQITNDTANWNTLYGTSGFKIANMTTAYPNLDTNKLDDWSAGNYTTSHTLANHSAFGYITNASMNKSVELSDVSVDTNFNITTYNITGNVPNGLYSNGSCWILRGPNGGGFAAC